MTERRHKATLVSTERRRALKPITEAGVATALQKAHRYRLLNDSIAAESICLDVLAIAPTNVEAITLHVLAITDQLPGGHAAERQRAEEAAAGLTDPYRHAYYRGVICERWAKALLQRAGMHSKEEASGWINKALDWYAKAEALRTPGNDEAILRWNSCLRILQRDPQIRPREEEVWEPSLE